MKKIFLVRHGQVDFGGPVRLCIGRSDYPLSPQGIKQAESLSHFFRSLSKARFFSSPLQRARQTAEIIAGEKEVSIIDDLREMDMGEWEGRPLKGLKKGLSDHPSSGEKREEALARFKGVLDLLVRYDEDDFRPLVIIAHAGVISLFLAQVSGVPLDISRSFPQAYGCFNELDYDGSYRIRQIGRMPVPYPDRDHIEDMTRHYGMPDHIRTHCQKVADFAYDLAEAVNRANIGLTGFLPLSPERVFAAASLHDIARLEKNHAEDGANILNREGYPEIAKLIRSHHRPSDPFTVNEESLLFYADKRIQEDQIVSLADRFQVGLEKINKSGPSKPAMESFYLAMRQAYIIENQLREMLGEGSLNPKI